MTLLASERSMLIRSKFRSVLQLRMQHRRSQEQHLLTPLTKPVPTYLEVNGTPEQSRANETLKVKVQTRTHKPGAAKGQFTEESGGDPSERKEKKTRLAEDLKEKLLQRPGPLELVTKNILSLDASLRDAAPPRPKKAKDPKPKVRKLKYHQYVPPAARPPRAPAPLDAAYARLLQQQQLFLQLQILQRQQPPAPPGPPTALCVPALHPLSTPLHLPEPPECQVPRLHPLSARYPPAPPECQPELLPANLDDLTKTSLGGWNGGVRLCPPRHPPHPQVSELRQQLRQRGQPVSGTKPALLERLKPFQCGGPRGRPPPALPPADRALREKQRLIESLTWELRREQQEADDLREELQLRKCRRGRPEGEPRPPSPLASHGPRPPAGETAEGTAPGREGFLVFCPPSCEPIGEDLELPLQITASPAPAPRSLEEELQEAIQKAQLVPSQSIEDILEEPLGCAGDLLPTDAPLLLPTEPRRPSSPLSQQGAPSKKPRRSPSAAAILDFPGHYDFLTPPSSSSSSPSDSLRGVFSPEPPEGPPSPGPRPAFDPVDWLEALTAGPASGMGPGAPGSSSIFSTDFFDSPELSVNHMIDLMVEQW
ncbi:LOW QUALITY PROTEIN: MEF2-activating motif and SAP domain-containing transcriptional regulator [Caretta caretta]|uniref:LOW QUALITY PROTEIN: MEF2-activating motif and SAP domain-containing transcriptional regulator n=1 Tax=Caretta caretta TaxID=8467 RepID=UPI003F4C8F67